MESAEVKKELAVLNGMLGSALGAVAAATKKLVDIEGELTLGEKAELNKRCLELRKRTQRLAV